SHRSLPPRRSSDLTPVEHAPEIAPRRPKTTRPFAISVDLGLHITRIPPASDYRPSAYHQRRPMRCELHSNVAVSSHRAQTRSTRTTMSVTAQTTRTSSPPIFTDRKSVV